MGVKVTSGGCQKTRVAVAKTGVTTRAAPTVNPKVTQTKVSVIGGSQGPPGLPADAAVQAGVAIPADFSGSPLTASITLPDAYPDANYSAAAQATTVSGRLIPVNVKNYTATGFDLELCSQNLDGLESVRWQTTPYN